MSNWKPGDLALCVKLGPWQTLKDGPSGAEVRPGEICIVESVRLEERLYLRLVGHTPGLYSASRFRKITPEEADEFDRETIDLMLGKSNVRENV